MDLHHQGLSSKEIALSREKYGINEIDGQLKVGLVDILIRQFRTLFTLLLLFASIISVLLGENIDAIFILLVIVLNAILGFYQEYKAEKSLKALKKLTISEVNVIRDGNNLKIASKDLVVGDLVELFEGDKVPADLEILGKSILEIDESSLTGESRAVLRGNKEMGQSLFAGTVVIKGHGFAIVKKVGKDTKFGYITQRLSGLEEQKTPLQEKLDKLGRKIGILGILLSIFVFIVLYLQGNNILKSLLFSSSLAVAAVPEGLPAIVTISLALGVERMSKRYAILKKLTALEGLGSTTLVATDKTGTLTTNEMRVKYIFQGTNDPITASKLPKNFDGSIKKLFTCAYLCSQADIIFDKNGKISVIGNTTEGAMMILGEEKGWKKDELLRGFTNIQRSSYDQTKKMITATAKDKNGLNHKYYQGAAEYLINDADLYLDDQKRMKLTSDKREEIRNLITKTSSKGFRILGFGEFIDGKLVFLGFVALEDPIREEVRAEIIAANKAGIRVVMITGDNELTASRVAIDTLIMKDGDEYLVGKQIDEMTDEALLAILPKVQVFARTTPDHKYRLVKLFQRAGYVVTVTGDGVNDALALKQAQVGVAMGGVGTEVAKETADIILTDDNFSTLMFAVREGRVIFAHIRQSLRYVFCTNATEIFVVLGNLWLNVPFSLTALQLLYINMVSDVLPAISFGFKPASRGIWKKRYNKELLTKSDIVYILTISLFSSILILFSSRLLLVLYPQIKSSLIFVALIGMQVIIYIDIWIGEAKSSDLMTRLSNSSFWISILTLLGLLILVMSNPFIRNLLHLHPLSFLEVCIIIALDLTLLLPIYFFRIEKNIRV